MMTFVESPPELAVGLTASRATLRAYCARIGVPAQDREDVIQEAMVRAWGSRRTFDETRPIEPWICTIALRVWIDVRVRRTREVRSSDGSEVERAVATDVSSPEVRLDLEGRLAGLRRIERDLLLGFHRNGHSVRELARQFDLPENTVKSHLRRARHRLIALESEEHR